MSQTVTIAEVMLWLHLVTTRVNGLSFRAVLTPGKLITSTGEVSTPDHVGWLKDVGIGADEVVVLEGDHPAEALLTHIDELDYLARDLFLGHKAAFFETREGSNEEMLGEALASRIGVSISRFWHEYTYANNPEFSLFNSKIVQRHLLEEDEQRGVFLPYAVVPKDERKIRRAIYCIQEATRCNRVLVRVDGEATGDGQMVFPNHEVAEIMKVLGRFPGEQVLVEPFCEHIPISGLMMLDANGAQVRGLTDQLMYEANGKGKIFSAGNLILDGDLLESRLPLSTYRNAIHVCETLGGALWKKGVRGPMSVDLLVLPTGWCYATEANIRATNGSYALDLHEQLRHRHGRCVTGLNVFKLNREGIEDFKTFQRSLGSLLYEPGKAIGLIPVVTTILPGQCHVGVVAESLTQYEELLREAWRFFACDGNPPVVTSDMPSHAQFRN